MSRLTESLLKAKEAGKKLLVPFFTGFYPDEETFIGLLKAAQRAGADAVEVGIPFSDPSADGPVIQRTSQLALQSGATLEGIFRAVKRARAEGLVIPLLYMTYYNPVHNMGSEKFSQSARESGADGVLVVDLPPEEAGEFAPAARSAGLDTVFLVAPTTPEKRLPLVLKEASGFVYCVSVAGVTGEKKPVTELVAEMVAKVRPLTNLPVLVGFGVSTPAGAKEIAKVSDGVIVGSALLEKLGDETGEKAVAKAENFLRELRAALDS
ncbi:tryptophan synthase subunit alpha [bacterium]|nr:MAG: tryptophan synthase subunit alpha [bacterium]